MNRPALRARFGAVPLLCLAVVLANEAASNPAPIDDATEPTFLSVSKFGGPVTRADFVGGPVKASVFSVAGSWAPGPDDIGWLHPSDGSVADGPTHAVALLSTAADAELRRDLAGLGVDVIGWYPEHALLVQLDAGDDVLLADLADLPQLRWLGAFPPDLKLHPSVSERLVAPDPERLIALRVAGFGESTSDWRALRADVAAAGFDIASEGAVDLLVEGPEDRVADLAAGASVLAISPGWWMASTSHAFSMPLMQADRARGPLAARGAGVSVGIVDSGYENEHSMLPEPGSVKSFVSSGCGGGMMDPLNDGSGHGTHVAGTAIGRNDGLWTFHQGVAIEAGPIHVARIFDDNNSGDLGDAYDGLEWMVQTAGADVVNNSWSADQNCGGLSNNRGTGGGARLADRLVFEDRSTLVFAAGNEGACGSTSITTPGDAKNVISVGSINDFSSIDRRSTFSSMGPTADARNKPDIVAPGSWITSADAADPDGFIGMHGTSMATPHVVGAAAALIGEFSVLRSRPDAIKAMLRATSLDVRMGLPDDEYGSGRVEMDRLLRDRDQSDGWVRGLGLGGPLSTGQMETEGIGVNQGTRRLTLVLTWMEPPAASGAGRAAINNLDLLLWDPQGNLVDISASMRDTVETIVVDEPMAGMWQVAVDAAQVNTADGQEYAVAWFEDRGASLGEPETALTCTPATVTLGDSTTCSWTVTSTDGVAGGVQVVPLASFRYRTLSTEWWLRDGSGAIQASGNRLTVGDVSPADVRQVDFTMQMRRTGAVDVRTRTTDDNGSGGTIDTFTVNVNL